MAENIYITGAASGAFKEALDGIPKWATQKTAQDIELLLKKILKVQTTALSGNNTQDNYNDSFKKLVKDIEEYRKKKKKEDDEDKVSRLKRELDNDRLKTSGDKVVYAFTLLSALGVKVMGVFKTYGDVYGEIYKSGINVVAGAAELGDGFFALNKIANNVGFDLKELSQIMQRYSGSLNAIGALKFSAAIKSSVKELNSLGFNSKESAELIASMIEANQGFTDMRSRTESSLTNDAIRLGTQLDRLSMTVGLNRAQLLENLKANSRSSESVMIAAVHGEEAAKKVAQFVSSFKDQNVGKMFQQMASSIDPVFTKVYQDLQKSGMGDLAVQLGQIAKDSRHLDPVETQRRLDAFVSNISPERIKQLNAYIASGHAESAEALSLLTGLQQHTRSISKRSKEEEEAARRTQAALSVLETQYERFKTTLQRMFPPMTGALEMLGNGLTWLNDTIDTVINYFSESTRSFVGIGLAITGVIGGLWGAVKSINVLLSFFGKGGSAIGGALTGITNSISAAGRFIFTGLQTAFGFLFKAIGGIASFIGNSVVKIVGWLGSIIKAPGQVIAGIFSKFSGIVGRITAGIASAIAPLGSIIARFLPTIGLLVGAFEIGRNIGTYIYDIISNITSVIDVFDTVFVGIDKLLSYIPGSVGTDAEKRLAAREAVEKTQVKPAGINTPAVAPQIVQPTVNNTNTTTTNTTVDKTNTTTATTSEVNNNSTNVVTEQSSKDLVNSLPHDSLNLEQQTVLLQRLLTNMESLVSVNKDILKYVKIS